MNPISFIHDAAAKGFQTAAEAYERGRPEYPPAAINFLISTLNISSGKTVVDLGAGTGKLTRLLASEEAKLIAIEPVEGMRRKFASLLPEIEILAGTAESIPLASASVDIVVVAQAFHWFQGANSLQEIHRVLQSEGRLGLIWNVRDESVEWVAKITEIIAPYQGNTPRYRSSQWKRAFDETVLFAPLQTQVFHHVHEYNRATLVDRVASISFIAALPTQTRQQVLREVRDLLDRYPLTKGQAAVAPLGQSPRPHCLEKISHPYRTDIFWCDKRNHSD